MACQHGVKVYVYQVFLQLVPRNNLDSLFARAYKKAIVIYFEFLHLPHVTFTAQLSEKRLLQLGVEKFVNSDWF